VVYYFIPALKRGATNCQRFTSCPAINGGVKSKTLLGFSPIFTQQLETTIEPRYLLSPLVWLRLLVLFDSVFAPYIQKMSAPAIAKPIFYVNSYYIKTKLKIFINTFCLLFTSKVDLKTKTPYK